MHTDETNNYRNYDASQIAELSRILALKELELSLEQIAKLVNDNLFAEELRGMFTLRKVQIEQSLQDEAARLAVETWLRQLERAQTNTRADIVLKSVPAQPFLSFRKTYTTAFDAVATIVELSSVIPQRF